MSIWPFLLYNQPKTEWFYGTSSPPPWNKTPLIPNTCINIVNIMWEWGLVSQGGTMLQRQKNENVAISSSMFYINNRFLWQFLRIFFFFCMKTEKFLSFFLIVMYVCKEYSISIRFSRFSVFLYLSIMLATIVYPCRTLTLFLRIPTLLSDLLLLGYITNCK